MEFDYFFQYDSEQQARADPVVSPYLAGNVRLNIWPFDLSPYPISYEGWWCMIAQSTQISTLTTSPNMKFFLVLPADILFRTFNDGSEFTVVSYATGKAIYASDWSFGPAHLTFGSTYYILGF